MKKLHYALLRLSYAETFGALPLADTMQLYYIIIYVGVQKRLTMSQRHVPRMIF